MMRRRRRIPAVRPSRFKQYKQFAEFGIDSVFRSPENFPKVF
jgi:hypothetical protein